MFSFVSTDPQLMIIPLKLRVVCLKALKILGRGVIRELVEETGYGTDKEPILLGETRPDIGRLGIWMAFERFLTSGQKGDLPSIDDAVATYRIMGEETSPAVSFALLVKQGVFSQSAQQVPDGDVHFLDMIGSG